MPQKVRHKWKYHGFFLSSDVGASRRLFEQRSVATSGYVVPPILYARDRGPSKGFERYKKRGPKAPNVSCETVSARVKRSAE